MLNRVDNPVSGTRPQAVRPGTERAEQDTRAAESTASPDASTSERVEISTAAREQAQAPPPERGAAQDTPSAEPQGGADSAVGSATREQAEQLREDQRQQAQPESQQPGNLVDVTG